MNVVELNVEQIPDNYDICIFSININDKNVDRFSFNLEYFFEWVEEQHYEWFLHHVISSKCSIDYDFDLKVEGSFDEFIGKLKKIYLTKI